MRLRSDGLFCSDYDEETIASLKRDHDAMTNNEPPPSDNPRKTRRKRQSNKVSAKERRESIQVGFEPALARNRKAGSRNKSELTTNIPKGSKASNPTKSKATGRKNATSRGSKLAGKGNGPRKGLSIEKLLHSDIIGDAQANSSKPAIPSFSSKDKKKALNELVGFIPNANSSEVKSDKAAIHRAIKKFDPPPGADGKGGWKLPGMKTSLFHHQVRYHAMPQRSSC